MATSHKESGGRRKVVRLVRCNKPFARIWVILMTVCMRQNHDPRLYLRYWLWCRRAVLNGHILYHGHILYQLGLGRR